MGNRGRPRLGRERRLEIRMDDDVAQWHETTVARGENITQLMNELIRDVYIRRRNTAAQRLRLELTDLDSQFDGLKRRRVAIEKELERIESDEEKERQEVERRERVFALARAKITQTRPTEREIKRFCAENGIRPSELKEAGLL